MESLGKLALALSKAQAKSKPIEHDALNQFHKYRYTSSEAIIEAAIETLAGCELAVIPTRQDIDRTKPEIELVSTFILAHSSGEHLVMERRWPIIPDKGRPLDKATAAAATVSLAYLLRDLLLMPRVDQATDMSGRNDSHYQPSYQSQHNQQQPQQPPPQDDIQAKVLASIEKHSDATALDSIWSQLRNMNGSWVRPALDKLMTKATGLNYVIRDNRILPRETQGKLDFPSAESFATDLEAFNKKLSVMVNPQQLTEMIPVVTAMRDPLRQACKRAMMDFATSREWEYDVDSKSFGVNQTLQAAMESDWK